MALTVVGEVVTAEYIAVVGRIDVLIWPIRGQPLVFIDEALKGIVLHSIPNGHMAKQIQNFVYVDLCRYMVSALRHGGRVCAAAGGSRTADGERNDGIMMTSETCY